MAGFRVAARSLGPAAIIAVLLTGSVQAQVASTAEIIDALAPQYRSLSNGPMSTTPTGRPSRDAVFFNGLRGQPSYTLSSEDRDRLARLTSRLPQINLTIEFDRGSDALHGEALTAARNLGAALTSEHLRGGTFVIAGHTDAKGSEATNQVLSERRAEALKRYLVVTFDIPAGDLITVGYGKTRLKNPADPESRENRRVQVVNTETVQTAGR